MKKIAIMAVAAITLASCGQVRPPKAEMKNNVDTLSYAIGSQLGSQFVGSGMLARMEVDSTNLPEFMKGVNEAVTMGQDKEKAAYMAGLTIGSQLSQMMNDMDKDYFTEDTTKTFSRENMLAAFFQVLKGDTALLLKNEQASMMYQSLMMESQQKARERQMAEYAKQMEEQYGENKAAGEKFLAENKKKEGVITTESGLQYKVLKAGNGPVPTANQRVKVEYEGKLIDGTVFDASSKHGNEPAVFSPGQVIKGWTEALTMMPVGSEWELYIPQELAYGPQDQGTIKPFSTLIFNVKLIGIEE